MIVARIKRRIDDKVMATIYDGLEGWDNNFLYCNDDKGNMISWDRKEYYLEKDAAWLKTVKEA